MEEGREIVNGYPSTEGEIAPKKEISEEELGNLISAFGNHEVKALTLAAMRPGIIYTRRASEGITLAHEFHQHLQGRRTIWRIDADKLFDYCHDSLSHPLTLVTKETVDSDLSVYGYMITPYGIEIGQALAGHLLEWSLKFDKSLIQVFGATSSSRGQSKEIEIGVETVEFIKRSPMTRLKVFWGLLTSSSLPIREVDLADAIRENAAIISSHLTNLARSGIIDYQAKEVDKPYARYQLAKGRPDQKPALVGGEFAYLTLTDRIYNLFISNPNLKAFPAEVYQRLVKIYPDYQERSQKSMEVKIAKILPYLEKQGYLEHERFRGKIQSEINLSDDQKIMLYELLEILDRFQGGDEAFWSEGRRKAQDNLANPEKLAKLMTKTHETSPYAARTPREILEEQLLLLVSEHPESTPRQIQEFLEEKFGKKLDISTISRFLRKSGKFVPQARRTAVYWTVKTD